MPAGQMSDYHRGASLGSLEEVEAPPKPMCATTVSVDLTTFGCADTGICRPSGASREIDLTEDVQTEVRRVLEAYLKTLQQKAA